MKINFFDKLIGSGFYTGYIPFASGTFGSLAALLIYWIPGFEKNQILIPAIIIFTFYGIYLGTKFEGKYGKDPKECTVDEVVGMWLSLLFIPKSILLSAIAFIIWRALDVIKPSPARQLEDLKGGIGIMMDDVVSGIYTAVIMNVFVYFYGKF